MSPVKPPSSTAPRDASPGRLADRLSARLQIGQPPLRPSGASDLDEGGGPAPVAGELGPSARRMLERLARTVRPGEVMEVMADGGQELAHGDLPEPFMELVGQIRSEMERRRAVAPSSSPGPRPVLATRGAQARGDRSPVAEKARAESDARLGRLARRLSKLIHLAEVDRRRLEARKQVRMAEDTPEALAEATPRARTESPFDLDGLGREVLHRVLSILESREERRLEEPDVRSIWW